jgi:hypothetical protein
MKMINQGFAVYIPGETEGQVTKYITYFLTAFFTSHFAISQLVLKPQRAEKKKVKISDVQ